MFVVFTTLWTPDKIDTTWMKQAKSVTQFIKNVTLMIKHTAILHQAPPNKCDEAIPFNLDDDIIDASTVISDRPSEDDLKDKAPSPKPIDNPDIGNAGNCLDLFKKFTKQSHKEVFVICVYICYAFL